LEDLSDATFLGKLLVLPANARLDWKVIARYKHSSLFGLVICSEEKRFITFAPGRRRRGSRLFRPLHFCDEVTLLLGGDGQLTPEVVGGLLDGQPLQVRDVEPKDEDEDRTNLKILKVPLC